MSRYTPYNQPVADAGQFRLALWSPRDLLHAAHTLATVGVSVVLFAAALWTLGAETDLVTLAPAAAWERTIVAVITHPTLIAVLLTFPAGVVVHEWSHANALALFTDHRIHVQLGQFARSDVPAAVYHFRWMDEQIPWYGVVATSLAPALVAATAALTFYLGGFNQPPVGVGSGVLIGVFLATVPSGGDIAMVRHAVYLRHLGGAHEQARARHAAVHG